ncbi:MAG: pyrroline-5-carboxylate reductase [Clostridiales bacterium]|jgi:pyrroline-5-carboxylate reductase|nr:pyrroline-5-carboxylate reductase [Clostridiales bacterium]OPZ67927.1 MAG: Pyrroline-5-carboxylate reductase [Firmicutes bacterium ADurb.Bin467]
MNIGFIGSGNMGGAIARGIVKSGAVGARAVFVYDTNPSAREALAKDTGATAVESPRKLSDHADILVLAVKPVYARAAVEAFGDALSGKAVVSIVAGLPGGTLKKLLPANTRYLQTMPNTPALVGEGVTALSEEHTLTTEEFAFVKRMFESVGRVATLPERLIEAESALAGSGPAYAAMFIEALADGGVLLGLPRAQAMEMAAQTLIGTAKLMLGTGKHPGEIKDMVCSPGGTTIEAVRALEQGGFRASVIGAVCAAGEKALRLKREAEKG